MKPFFSKILFFLFMALSGNALFAQQTNSLEKLSPTAYGNQYPLLVGTAKTTVLIFPGKIAAGGVDLGSTDIIASTVTGVDNILRVKAASENFAPTNATVITTDGKVYSFYVSFSDYPDDRPIDMGKQLYEEKAQAELAGRLLNDAQVSTICRSVCSKKPFLKKPKVKSYGVQLSLKGIYAEKDMLFFQLELKNKSPMEYTVDFSRFYVRDRKRAKRTAWQEQELTAREVYDQHAGTTAAGSTQYVVLAFPKFTIADHKQFVIQIFEKNGDRHLELKIDGKKLMQAHRL